MSIEIVRAVLLWCTVINFGVVLLWVLLFTLAHDWGHRLTGKWCRLTVEQFNAIHYAAILLYEIGIILFNLVPYIALRIVG